MAASRPTSTDARAAHIERLVDQAPPLDAETWARLRQLLRPAQTSATTPARRGRAA